jgi:hypothetical protein
VPCAILVQCRLFTTPSDAGIFHCDKCGICRVKPHPLVLGPAVSFEKRKAAFRCCRSCMLQDQPEASHRWERGWVCRTFIVKPAMPVTPSLPRYAFSSEGIGAPERRSTGSVSCLSRGSHLVHAGLDRLGTGVSSALWSPTAQCACRSGSVPTLPRSRAAAACV